MQTDATRTTYALGLAAASVVCNFVVLGLCFLIFNLSGKPTEDTNALAVSITTIEIFLVIVALGGFWMLRTSVLATARSETRQYLKDQETALKSAVEKVARETAETTASRVLEELLDSTPKPQTDKQTAAFDGD